MIDIYVVVVISYVVVVISYVVVVISHLWPHGEMGTSFSLQEHAETDK